MHCTGRAKRAKFAGYTRFVHVAGGSAEAVDAWAVVLQVVHSPRLVFRPSLCSRRHVSMPFSFKSVAKSVPLVRLVGKVKVLSSGRYASYLHVVIT